MCFHCFVSFFVLFIIVPFISFSQQLTLTQKLPIDTLVTIGKFPNGLTYYIRTNKKPEHRVELRLVVKAGSILEDDDQQGLAHFVEHMAFNGTKNFPKQDLVNFLERTGVRFGPHLNAYTSFDETVYMLQVPTDSFHIVEKAFQILDDWSQNITFDNKEIDKERGVVGEEWRLGRGANERVNKKHYPVIFFGSKYANRLPIGKKEVIDTAQYETVKRFYRDWYRPELMAVIAVGDFDKLVIEALIKKHFEDIPLRENNRERTKYTLTNHSEPLISTATDAELPYTMVQVLFTKDERKDRIVSDYRQSILNQLYDGMFNKRIGELLQKPNPPFAYGYGGYGNYIGGMDSYTLYLMAKENSIKEGTEVLLTEAYRVAKFGFTESELERQKKEVLRGMEKTFNERDKTESDSYVNELTRNFLKEEPIPGIGFEYELYKQFIPGMTLSEINAISSQRITKENRAIIISAPKKEGVTLPADSEMIALIDETAKNNITAYSDEVSTKPLVGIQPKSGKVVTEKLIKEIGVTEWLLSNGAKVVLKPTDFKNDEILFSGTSFGGNSLASDKDYLSSSYASALVSIGGIAEFDAIQLQKMLSGKIASASPSIGELTEGISGSVSPKDVETMFQLAYLRFTAPRKDTGACGAYLSRIRTYLVNRDLNPETAFSDTIATTMSRYHFRSYPVTAKRLDELNIDKAFSFYKERFADASDFTFFLVGNFNLKSIKPFVEKYLASLPNIKRKEMWKDIGIKAPTGIVKKEVFKGVEPKSSVRMTFGGKFEWNRQNRYDLNAMTEVLRIKLREQLREEKGGVYGVSVSGSPSLYPRKEYSISISFGCSPDRVEELIGVVNLQIDSLKKYTVTGEYVSKVKELQRRDQEVNLKENRFWLSNISSAYYYGEDPVLILQRNKLINELTTSAVKKAAVQYFSTPNVATFVLRPEKK